MSNINNRYWFRILVVFANAFAFNSPQFKFFLGLDLAIIIIRLWDLA